MAPFLAVLTHNKLIKQRLWAWQLHHEELTASFLVVNGRRNVGVSLLFLPFLDLEVKPHEHFQLS